MMASRQELIDMIRERTPRPFPATTPAAITAFEDQIGVELPEDYRSFLLAHNGGWLEPWIAIRNVVPDQQSDAQQDFFGIGAIRRGGDLDWNLCLFDDNPNPIKVLAIGSTIGGRYICLYLHDDDYGAVYYKDFHDWYRIADSFTGFLELLDPEG